uniref:Leucine-rich repeat-containing N-terminal plant-type domain-containing protein n=1 Tax=Fagus sylvatica TaxID=28930 RepID=A0A2N9F3N0_FAGSY
MLTRFLALFSLYYLIFASFSLVQPLCLDDESFALLQFKGSFIINQSASDDPSAYPKVSSWKLESDDCCSWDGVECDKDTGHVISLDLSSSCLYGSINSSSSLFRLVNLQRLNLSDNNFNDSRIPSGVRQLSKLAHLDLSFSCFSGQIPLEILQLSKLVYLDLSRNRLKLQNPDLRSLVEKLTNMKKLFLSDVNISSALPNSFSNLTSLTSLFLTNCHLHGEFPTGIFRLPNLEDLRVRFNPDLTGYQPEFNRSSPLKLLKLTGTSFYGKLPDSIGNLKLLHDLEVGDCNFSGPLPPSLGNLTQLANLRLGENGFHGSVPSSIYRLVNLEVSTNFLLFYLEPIYEFWILVRTSCKDHFLSHHLPSQLYSVSNNTLTGEIPLMICNLSSLVSLDLSYNNLSGLLPKCLGTFSDSLTILNLRHNKFHGNIPQTCKKGSKLKMIDFSENQLQGSIPRSLVNCTMLETLVLGNNQINGGFPFWLGVLHELRVLILRYNELQGAIGKPKSNLEFPNLHILDLSNNHITDKLPFEYFQIWKAMHIIDVDGPMYMQATTGFELPSYEWSDQYSYSMTFTNKGREMPYEKILYSLIAIDLSSNKFEGEIPEVMQNLKGIRFLNLSHNLLTGSIPSSLGKLTVLESLDLSQNKLSGEIPPQLTQLTFLAFFNVSNNHLTGPIPHGKQFDTFPNKSFDGNPGLCGIPLSMKCGHFEGSLPPPSTFEEINHDSNLQFDFSWKVIVDWLNIKEEEG